MAEVEFTNYELNKQAYQKIPAYTQEQKIELRQKIAVTFSEQASYIGILCRERNDYTLIHVNNNRYLCAAEEIIEVLESRGDIIDSTYIEPEDFKYIPYYQVWVRESAKSCELAEILESVKWTPQINVYMIFNAKDWVIEAGVE